jgi:hypothetical protein
MDVADLYGLPLDRYVAERTALSRALRARGQREDAAAVAARAKPSVAAWAVNQLILTQKREVTSLLAAGDALREAQDDVVSGRGDGHALRAAAEAERGAVDALVTTARGLLSSDGHQLSPAILERVAETLHAAALDDDARGQVSTGCIERELRHVGFGGGAGLMPAPRPSRAPKRTATAGKAGARRTQARQREQAEQAERERAERERAQARKAARAAVSEARRRADHADRAVVLAQERRDRAEQAFAEAEQALTAARSEAQAAAQAQGRAQEDLNDLSD